MFYFIKALFRARLSIARLSSITAPAAATVMAAVFLLISFASDAEAIPITFTYEGEVAATTPGAGAAFIGETMRLRFTFDNTSPPTGTDASGGLSYVRVTTDFTFSFLGSTWTSDDVGFALIDRPVRPTIPDQFSITTAFLRLESGPNPFPGDLFGLNLIIITDFDGLVSLSDITEPFLPTPGLVQFLVGDTAGTRLFTNTVRIVPAPATWPLLGVALGSIVIMRRRHKKAA